MVVSSMIYVETFMKLFVKISSVTQAKEKTERMFNSKELSNMATANFEIGNKEFDVRFIPESGYSPTKNERGSSLVEYDVTTYKDNQPMMKKFNQKKRVYFDLEGNVYKDKHSNKVWFNLDYERM